jgi:hypothetical protein
VIARIPLEEIREPRRGYWSRGDTKLIFEPSAMVGETRRTTVSTSNAEDDGVAFVFYFGPQFRVVQEHVSPFSPEYSFQRGDVFGQPVSHFLQELKPTAKANIDEIHSLAVQRVEAGRHG